MPHAVTVQTTTPSPAPAPGKGPQIQRLFGDIAHRYDLANHLLSGGLDFLWRRRVARIVKAWNAARILDVATGSGDLALAMKKACPGAEVTGTDFCAPMLEQARRKGVEKLVQADALDLPFEDASFDAVTVAFGLRNMESYAAALREMARVLRPGGHLLVLDFSVPGGVLRTPYRFYLHRILPRLAGAITGDAGAYQYLGASIEEFPQGAAMCELIGQCGLARATSEPRTFGIVSIYTAEKI